MFTEQKHIGVAD